MSIPGDVKEMDLKAATVKCSNTMPKEAEKAECKVRSVKKGAGYVTPTSCLAVECDLQGVSDNSERCGQKVRISWNITYLGVAKPC